MMTMRQIAGFSLLIIAFLLSYPAGLTAKPDLTGSKGETVFFLLGMLDEYGGRYHIEDSERVESFYCNEHVAAYVFRVYLDRLAREQDLDPIIADQWRQDCLVSFHSKALSEFINQFYSYHDSLAGYAQTDKGPKRLVYANFAYDQFDRGDVALKHAYLAGTYFRYGSGDGFRFANSARKRDLVVRLLNELGCDSVSTESRAGLPAHNDVTFEPTNDISEVFQRLPGPWAFAAADSAVGFVTFEETIIYREVIRMAGEGRFEGCPLNKTHGQPRFTFIPMDKPKRMPGMTGEQAEAFAGYDSACTTLRSVSAVPKDSTFLIVGTPRRDSALASLGRIGFSSSGTTAATVLFYWSGSGSERCSRAVTVFLSKEPYGWAVTNYSIYR
jgi:hypothetical protein